MGFIKKLLKAEPDPDKANKLIKRGVELAKRGDLDAALKAYRDAQRVDPTSELARTNEALALLDRFNRDKDGLEPHERPARLEEIRGALEVALDYVPDDLDCLRGLLHVRRRLGDYAAAARTAMRLLGVAPEHFQHRAEVEEALRQLTPRAARQAAIETATKLILDDDAEKDGLAEALEALKPHLEGDEVERDALWCAGVLARRLGDENAAVGHFTGLLKIAPRAARAHRELADLYAHQGKAKQALEHSLEAYRADPADPGLVCNVGVCFMEIGELDQAEEYLEIARGLDPGGAIIQKAWATLQKARHSTST